MRRNHVQSTVKELTAVDKKSFELEEHRAGVPQTPRR